MIIDDTCLTFLIEPDDMQIHVHTSDILHE